MDFCGALRPDDGEVVVGCGLRRAGRSSIGTDDFAQKCLGSLITMQDTIFATFFIIDDELNGDPGVLGPLCMRRFRAIAR